MRKLHFLNVKPQILGLALVGIGLSLFLVIGMIITMQTGTTGYESIGIERQEPTNE